MRILAFTLLLITLIPASAADKIQDAIRRGMVTKEFTDTLTQDDVPAKWRTTVKDTQTDKYFSRLFSRGDRKVLEVMWSKDWVSTREKMFVATVYDGDYRLAKIVRVGDNTNIASRKEVKGYEWITSVKDDGSVSLMVTGEKGYFDVILVRGRDSRLLDDLEYTKSALLMDHFLGPLLDAAQDQLESKPRSPKRK